MRNYRKRYVERVIDEDDEDDAERGILQDGEILRTRMLFMDSADPRAVASAAFADAFAPPLLHAPGYVCQLSDAELDERELAREAQKKELSDAWKSPPVAEAQLANEPAEQPATMLDRDALYAAHDAWLENAWRNP